MFQDHVPSIPNDSLEELRMLHGLKYGHTISMESHSYEPIGFKHIHSADNLSVRHPSYPAFVPDTSNDNVNETLTRRTNHREIFTAHPGVFRRKRFELSASETVEQRHLVRDLLTDMHPMRLKHEQTSRRPHQPDPERHPPIQDFLLPEDLTQERHTGYSSGHIRSLLGIDTFGPNCSSRRELQRVYGEIPSSPQIDRNRHIRSPKPYTADGRLFDLGLVEPPLSPHSTGSRSVTSHPSLSQSLESQRFDSPLQLPRSTPYSKSRDLNQVGTGKLSKSIPSGTLGYYGPALSEEERSLSDAKHKQLTYYNDFVEMKKESQRRTEEKMKQKQYRKKMNEEAKKERESIVQFESTLQTCYV